MDAEGYVWSALVYGGKLLRFAPDGSVDREIDVPVKKVTSVMFGGSNLDILFVTSMAKRPLPRFPGMECYVAACSPFTISAFKVCLKPGSLGSITGRCIVVFSSSRPSEISFVASANGSGSAGEIVVVARKKWVERSRRDSLPISSLIGL